MSEVLRVDAEKLQAAVAAIMEKEGVAPQDAAIVADSLVSAELTGLQSHGVQRVKFYTDSMEARRHGPQVPDKDDPGFPRRRIAGRPGRPRHRGGLPRHGAGDPEGEGRGHRHRERPQFQPLQLHGLLYPHGG